MLLCPVFYVSPATKGLCKLIGPLLNAVLVGVSSQLNDMGVIAHFADVVGRKLLELDLGWRSVFMLLNAAYFGLHYVFAAQASPACAQVLITCLRPLHVAAPLHRLSTSDDVKPAVHLAATSPSCIPAHPTRLHPLLAH